MTIGTDLDASLAGIQSNITALQAQVAILMTAQGPQPPPQAVAAGFTKLIPGLSDEFTSAPDIGYGTNGHKWYSSLWYQPIAAPSAYTWDSKSILTINNATLCTMSRDFSAGTTETAGYFECLVRPTNWSATWLFDLAHAQNATNPCGEIDIFETDGNTPDMLYQTIHSNTGGGGGAPDQYNMGKGSNVWNPTTLPGAFVGTWQKVGCLLVPGQNVQMFYNDAPTVSMAPYPSTSHPMFYILDVAPGGISHTSGPAVGPVTMDVDWVRAWH